MSRLSFFRSAPLRKFVLAAVAVTTLGLAASSAMADSYEDYGHWLCDSKGQCIWIWDR